MKKETVFVALYNPMIYESCFGIISIHKTKRSAEMALEFHKAEKIKEWKEMYPTKEDQEEFVFGQFEAWTVKEMDVEE